MPDSVLYLAKQQGHQYRLIPLAPPSRVGNPPPPHTQKGVGEISSAPVVIRVHIITLTGTDEGISLGVVGVYASMERFQGLVHLLPHLRPLSVPMGGGGDMWGVFGKALKKAIWNTLGLHAVLTICLRFSSLLDSVCVACCLLFVNRQLPCPHTGNVLWVPPVHHGNLWCTKEHALGVQIG